MGTGNIPLICFYDGKLINEDRNAKYEGGNKKAENVSNTIGFKEFNEKIRDMIQLPSSDDFKFKIKCGLCFDQETLIAVDVDDDKSLSYVFDHSKFIRAYIIKQEPSVTVITTQRQERSSPSRVIGNLHRGINDSEPCFTDDAGTDTSFQYDIDFVVGQEFPNADTFRCALSDLAVRTRREYKPVKTNKSRLTMKCRRAGCSWRIAVTQIRDLHALKVTKYHNQHTCPVLPCNSDHRQATIKWIASKIQADINKNPDMTRSKIISTIRNGFGIQISYNKAGKAKAKALEALEELAKAKALEELAKAKALEELASNPFEESPKHMKEKFSTYATVHGSLDSEPCVTNDSDIETPLPWNIDFVVDQEFPDADTFWQALLYLEKRTEREYKLIERTESGVVVKCRSESCNWHMEAKQVRGLCSFKVTKYHNLHTCPVLRYNADQSQATIKWIASRIQSDNMNPNMTPSEIIVAIRDGFGIEISYNDANESKLMVFEDSYSFLPGLIQQLKLSGCLTKLGCDKDNSFLYFFWALLPCVNAFRTYLRPILQIDTILIKLGVLMTAYGIDGNNKKLLVASAVFEAESELWWETFLELLKEFIIPDIHLRLPFAISTEFDRETSVLVVPKVFPEVHHCFNLWHFEVMFATKFKDSDLRLWMRNATRTFNTSDCDRYLEKIKEKNESAYEWLINAGKDHWCTAYGVSSGCLLERLPTGGIFMEDVEDLPITELVVYIINYIASCFQQRRTRRAQLATDITSECKMLVDYAVKHSHSMRLESLSTSTEYQVFHASGQFIVNLENGTCSCGKFQGRGMPCSHAAAVIKLMGQDIANHCQRWFSADTYRATYAENIDQILDRWQWHPHEGDLHILPPKRK